MFLALYFLLLTCQGVIGYGTGAPYNACDTLEPEHYGTVPQDHATSPFPYRVDVMDGDGYFSPGQYIRIKISGSAFRGFIMQVRDDIGRSRGMFVQVSPHAKAVTCRHDDDTLTHSTPMVKEEMVMTWRAPDNSRIKELFVVGTVLKSESVYWTGVHIPLRSSLHAKEL